MFKVVKEGSMPEFIVLALFEAKKSPRDEFVNVFSRFKGHRRAIWEDNLAYIDKHNTAAANGEFSYTLGVNKYADWTSQEFARFMNGYNSTSSIQGEINTFESIKNVEKEVNWVNEVE